MPSKSAKILLLLCLTASLISCNLFKYPVDAKLFNQHKKHNQQLNKWSNYITLTIKQDNNNYYYSCIWRQKDSITKINYLLADNSLLFEIIGDEQASFLQIDANKPDEFYKTDSNINQQFSKLIGYDFPLSDLVYWMRGLPNPNSIDKTIIQIIKGSHTISSIKQNNWLVTYQDYKQFDSYLLPTKLHLKSTLNPNLEYILEIEKWLPNEI